jgi:hypothetical protein
MRGALILIALLAASIALPAQAQSVQRGIAFARANCA